MYGETTPGVSAGSKSVGAREKWRDRVICPSGAAKARAGAANTSASATTMMRVRRLIWTSAPVILTDRGRLSMDRRSGARAPDRLSTVVYIAAAARAAHRSGDVSALWFLRLSPSVGEDRGAQRRPDVDNRNSRTPTLRGTGHGADRWGEARV